MKLLACFTLCSACLIWTAFPQDAGEVATSADAFVDSFGVNVHLHFTDTPYANFGAVKSALQKLGVHHVRDGLIDTSWTPYYDRHNELGRIGIKGTFITAPKNDDGLLVSYPNRMHDSFEAYEAPNEYDISGDPHWAATLSAFMQRLHNVVKSHPETTPFPIIGPSFTQAGSFQNAVALGSFFDYANLHNYFGGRNPGTPGWGNNGYGSIAWNLDLTTHAWPGKPVFTTETGYTNDAANPQGIPEDVSAKYLPRAFLEQWLHGIRRTYSYELVDLGSNHNDGSHGLLHSDFTPKLGYTAIQNLIHLLSDPGPTFTGEKLNFTLSGNLTSIHHLLLEKRDGSFYLTLWVEEPSFDVNGKVATPVSHRRISVQTTQPWKMRVHEIGADDTKTSAIENVRAHQFEIGDQVTILEMSR